MIRRSFACLLALTYLLCVVPKARADSEVAGANEPSRGDPKLYALMARQGFERDALQRGSTLAKLCTIRTSAGRPAYEIYWFHHLTQAAQVAHGRSELVLISAAGNVLGAYSYDGLGKPKCADGQIRPIDDLPGDAAQYVTIFAPDQLPTWLGDGGEFVPAPRYEGASIADGIWLPKASAPEFEPVAAQGRHRLPPGYRWGRCLLVVDDKTLISGRCAYLIENGGDFWISGPRQVYRGIDYPNPEPGVDRVSRDYWARLYRDEDGWTGYGNNDVTSTHGDRVYEALDRQGACLVNEQVRVCLWRD